MNGIAQDLDINMWNLKNLVSPSFKIIHYSKSQYDRVFGSTNFHLMFADRARELIRLYEKSRDPLQQEKSILESLIYKNWNTLRNERSMQTMKKIKRLLVKLNEMSIDKLTDTILRLLSNNKKTSQTDGKLSLPTREVMQYYLLRLFATYRLLSYGTRLVRFKLEPDLLRQMSNNVFLANNLLYTSAISRIYCIFECYQRSIVLLYNCLREYVGLFDSSNIEENILSNQSVADLPMLINESRIVRANEKRGDIGSNLLTLRFLVKAIENLDFKILSKTNSILEYNQIFRN